MHKKIISLMLVIVFSLSVCTSALAFSFPVPDWGALYYAKEDMVMEPDFGLYAEASVDTAPYYGAKFEPRGGAYIGSIPGRHDDSLPLGSYLTYIDYETENDMYYPANAMIERDNVITMLGWTVNDMGNVDYDRIRETLENLSRYNTPMFIRFANEMNCSNLGDDPAQYVRIFQTVADMVHEYPNFAVVWSPNDLGALDRPFHYFYPGDEYVDWIGVSSYSVKYFVGNRNTTYKDSIYFMTGDFSWTTNKLKPIVEFMEEYNINKPLMISEGGVATNNIYGEEDPAWTTPRLRNMLYSVLMKYPQVKMINYFDVFRQYENERYNIAEYPYATDIFNEAKNSGAYITEFGGSPDFVYQPANDAGTLVANKGKIRLHTLAYIPQQQDVRVTYNLDGSWYHSANQIPYTCNLDISGLSDGKHTLEIEGGGQSEKYTFYKAGKCIRFGQQPDAEIVEISQGPDITVTLNGSEIDFDQRPVLKDERTLVPLRAIFEALGAEVYWDNDTQMVKSYKNGVEISFTIGMNEMYKADEMIWLDVAPQLIGGRTMVPVRAIAEAFKCQVGWDDATSTVIITELF